MDLLARREHARAELLRKLADRFPESDEGLIHSALDQLEEDNLLSDERFTEACLRSRMSKGYGPLYIEQYLRERRVASALISAYLDAVDEQHWAALIEEVVIKKLGGASLPVQGSKAWQSLQRYLRSRGFTSPQIAKALRS